MKNVISFLTVTLPISIVTIIVSKNTEVVNVSCKFICNIKKKKIFIKTNFLDHDNTELRENFDAIIITK